MSSVTARVILGVGLLTTVIVSLEVKRGLEKGAVEDYSFLSDRITLKLEDRLNTYALILKGGAGLFAGSGPVDRQTWHAFVEKLGVPESLPGVQGIGFAQVIPAGQLVAHQALIRGEGFSGYAVHPPGERAFYTSIVYLEPFSDRNLSAFGFDMCSEPVRRAAMEQARDSGSAALSGKVELVQETGRDVQAGTLMYVPVYRNGAAVDTVERRRAALIGWTYGAYRMNDFMLKVLAAWNSHKGISAHIRIYDGLDSQSANLLFDSKPRYKPDSHSLVYQRRTIDFNGRQWLLEFDADEGAATLSYATAWATLIGGLSLSGLLFGLMISLANTQARAETIAARLTGEIAGHELALEASERRWRFAIEGAGDGLWDWNVPDSTMFFSPRWKSMLGYAEDEVGSGLDEWRKRVHPDDSARVMADVQAHIDGTTPLYRSEHRAKCKDGSWKWILDRGLVLERDATGKPLRMIGTQSDITERKQAEIVVRISEEHYRTLFEGASDGIFILSPNGRLVAVNESFARMHGYAAEEMQTMNLRDLDTPETTREVPERMRRILSGEHFTFEVEHYHRDGHVFPLEVSASLIVSEGGPLIQCFHRDITERRQVAAELANHRNHLEQLVLSRTRDLTVARDAADAANKAKSTFMATMSHELRTPLNAILGFSSLMLDGSINADADAQRKPLTIIHRSGEELLRLVQDILDLSSIEAGGVVAQLTDVHLRPALGEAYEACQIQARERAVESRPLVCDESIVVRADRALLSQVVRNLLGNALKFTDRGHLQVRAVIHEGLARIEVEDSGIGIPTDQQSRLFQPFQRVTDKGRPVRQGTGLGLSICRHLVEAMGGTIGVDSEPGRGSRFWFTVPLAAKQP